MRGAEAVINTHAQDGQEERRVFASGLVMTIQDSAV